jgi:hypothetical protein
MRCNLETTLSWEPIAAALTRGQKWTRAAGVDWSSGRWWARAGGSRRWLSEELFWWTYTSLKWERVVAFFSQLFVVYGGSKVGRWLHRRGRVSGHFLGEEPVAVYRYL